jgi:hypothetical protein
MRNSYHEYRCLICQSTLSIVYVNVRVPITTTTKARAVYFKTRDFFLYIMSKSSSSVHKSSVLQEMFLVVSSIPDVAWVKKKQNGAQIAL